MNKGVCTFIFALLIGVTESRSLPMEQHIHCTKNTCPAYTVIASFAELELRCYKPSIWVSISGSGKLYGKPHNLPTWKLTQFINGNNSKKIDVPIGSVSTHLFDESRGVYTAEYFIPFYFRTKMPMPVDKDVRVIYRRSFCAYVYGFSGWLVNYDIIPSRRTKTRSLVAKNFTLDNYYPDFFFYVSYRSGMQFIPQYNEIWYIIKFEEEDNIKKKEGDNAVSASNKTD